MLYDNGQLLSLYASAYKKFGDELYKSVVEETIHWLENDMKSPNGGYYSALDADSEGEEGKYYIWTEEELKTHLKEEYDLFAAYYNVGGFGHWAEGKQVLMRLKSDEEFVLEHALSLEELQQKKMQWKACLLEVRKQRIAPGLDDKMLCAWNAWTAIGLCEAGVALDRQDYIKLAKDTIDLLIRDFWKEGQLYRTKQNQGEMIPAFLEDYVALTKALTHYYEASFEESYLFLAQQLTDICLEHFQEKGQVLFNFRSIKETSLVSPTVEVYDSVMPSSNAMMLQNLLKMYQFFGESRYKTKAEEMLSAIKEAALKYPWSHAAWLKAAFNLDLGLHELVINDQLRMILSMTGYGKAEGHFNNQKYVLEVRSLNSRNLDANLRIPQRLRLWEMSWRKLLGEKLVRGKVDVSLQIESTGDQQLSLNEDTLKAYISKLKEFAPTATEAELLAMALRFSDVQEGQDEKSNEEEENFCLDLLQEAVDHLIVFRSDEGKALEDELRTRVQSIAQKLKEVEPFEEERIKLIRDKMLRSLEESGVNVDENRFEQEQLQSADSNGRKLNFISQEMGREINTMGSKANHDGIQRLVINMKDDLEKGALSIKKLYPDESLAIYIDVPDIDSLAQRLRDRNTESEEKLQMRISKAKEEQAFANRFDTILVNDELERAKAEI
ncbi:unnamed protein product, partial [Cyprideis torosa]